MIGFERKKSFTDNVDSSMIGVQGDLTNSQIVRLSRIKRSWDFYEGYHWEDMQGQDTVELSTNYCRAFVDKFVSFELGKSFSIDMPDDSAKVSVNAEGQTLPQFLNKIWIDNNQFRFSTEMGQMKSVSGESWIQARFYPVEELKDPFNKYPKGRIKVILMSTGTVFPEFDPHDKDVLTRLTIMYQYEKVTHSAILGRVKREQVLYKQIWTDEECVVIDGKDAPVTTPNKYQIIPFIQIKNLNVAGRTEGRSDLEDIIPLNTEYNMKQSDISEIIDYHAAPVTVVYGAKIGNLEKGAGKMWGGLAKDAKIENLELKSDLSASSNFVANLKLSMCEVAGIPETVLGGSQSISNTSGVALEYMNLPLIEKTRIKRNNTEDGLERLNELILLIALTEGFIQKPDDVSIADFFFNEVTIPDTLPKDMMIELQQIQLEMKAGLENRKGAMKRLGKDNIDDSLKETDKDRLACPEAYGIQPPQQFGQQPQPQPQLNSGITNSQTPIETVRKEMAGKNGGA